ncbi:hypothetical protein [Paenibacillus darwinianus]|nr:hypothetical protein [Paenibacillus darwinianus]
MATSRNHQGAHGIGQTEEQLQQQIEAATEIQGDSRLDRSDSELDEIIET